MATKKIREHLLTESGSYDTIHRETDASIVLTSDGNSVQGHLDSAVASGDGAHGFRYNATTKAFESYNVESGVWETVSVAETTRVDDVISYHNESTTAHDDIRNLAQDCATSAETASKEYTDTHIDDNANPHCVTAEQVGLGNADNTSDVDKPVSTAQQNALDTAMTSMMDYVDALIGNINAVLDSVNGEVV